MDESHERLDRCGQVTVPLGLPGGSPRAGAALRTSGLLLPCTWFETHVAQRNVRGTAAAHLLFREVASFRSLCAESWLLMGRKQATGPVVEVKSRMPEWAAPVQ